MSQKNENSNSGTVISLQPNSETTRDSI